MDRSRSEPPGLDASRQRVAKRRYGRHWLRPARMTTQLAAELATRAGSLLLGLRERLVKQGSFPATVLRAEGDRCSQELLSHGLAEASPNDAVLSEEAPDDPSRLTARRVSVIDPLDGPREFSEPDRSDWAVHVALALDGRPSADAVPLPALGLTLATLQRPDSGPSVDGPLRMVVSRSRPPSRPTPWLPSSASRR